MSGYLKNHPQLKVIILDHNFPEIFKSERQITLLSEILSDTNIKTDTHLLEQIKNSLKPETLFTIIYTSGTTGNPKGVMLSHANMLYQLSVVPGMLDMKSNDRILSILPVWHIFERFMLYCTMMPAPVIITVLRKT
jgi:long-chain acyl-CoA synthetase